MIAIGLMSGTSLDGVDAALVELRPREDGYGVRLKDFVTQPYEDELSRRLHGALPPNDGTLRDLAELHRDVGRAFARAARAVAANERVDFVASHGQSVWHDGERNVTLQIGDAFAIRETMNATVCYDFRSADTAAGGCGAPLVPYVDAMLLASSDESRVALNLGGIANLSVLPRGLRRSGSGAYDIVAFDTGPGNMLIDAFVRARSKGALRFDRGGALAARGTVAMPLLGTMQAHEYFSQPPPKSTGRELFGEQFLAAHAAALEALSDEDGAATLTALTAATVASAVTANAPDVQRVIVSGGGARNASLMAALAARLPGVAVVDSACVGVDPDAKEAIAFAILGFETLRGRPANVPRVTGARHGVVLGSIAPYDLTRLLVRLEAECAR
jgi:anhydro-N-acetylmuramic acid kinase